MKFLWLFVFAGLASCAKQQKFAENPSYKNTSIVVSDFPKSENVEVLDTSKVKSAFEKHFRSKGFLIERELDFATYDPEKPEFSKKLCVDYLNTIALHPNAGIVRYYKCEPFSKGNWVRPHFALVGNASKETQVLHDEFLSPNFDIDSVSIERNQTIIYGIRRESGVLEKTRKYRIALQ